MNSENHIDIVLTEMIKGMKDSRRHNFSYANSFKSNARLKLAKNQANAKQHRVTKLLLIENYSHSSSTLSSKNNRIYSKK